MGSSNIKKASARSFGMSHPGLARGNNEDALFLIDKTITRESESHNFGIYIIADGMGGHPGGEVASMTAMRTISQYLLEKINLGFISLRPCVMLIQAIKKAHEQILSIGRNKPELEFMGTTITVGFRVDHDLFLGHVGDSRAYLVREGNITQLTEDHSVVASLVKSGAISREEALVHPERGRVLRSLGIVPTINVDTKIRGNGKKLTVVPHDFLVFCSDGLTGMLSDKEILSCIDQYRDSELACIQLVRMANTAGGSDNISVIVVRMIN